jgi:hypothetical protein
MPAARTAAVALVLAAVATPPVWARPPASVFGLRAPREISGFRLNDATNFERIKPGDGYGLDYSQPDWKLDVFVYDRRRVFIPDDVGSAVVGAEFERAQADTFAIQPNGLYAEVRLKRNFTVEDDDKRARFRCAAFDLVRDGAKPQDGYLCVTAWNGRFVRLRLTTQSAVDSEAQARRYVKAWIPLLWNAGTATAAAVEPVAVERVTPVASRARTHRSASPRRALARARVCPPGDLCEGR